MWCVTYVGVLLRLLRDCSSVSMGSVPLDLILLDLLLSSPGEQDGDTWRSPLGLINPLDFISSSSLVCVCVVRGWRGGG